VARVGRAVTTMAFVVAAFRRLDVQRMVHSVLARDGHTVVLFRTGRPTIAEVVAGSPDLVIVEAQLLDMGAAEICRTLRAHHSTAAVPIVVCGPQSRSDTQQLRQAAGTGAVLRARLLPSDVREAVAVAVAASAGTLSGASHRM
jgi:CheY-like chemotaxis protein